MIGPQDLNRLVTEITTTFNAKDAQNIEPIGDWCKERDISDEGIRYLTGVLMDLWRIAANEEISSGESPAFDAILSNIEASILMAFSIGWEACREYGSK